MQFLYLLGEAVFIAWEINGLLLLWIYWRLCFFKSSQITRVPNSWTQCFGYLYNCCDWIVLYHYIYIHSVNQYSCLLCATHCSRCLAWVTRTALFTAMYWGPVRYLVSLLQSPWGGISSCVSSRKIYTSPKQDYFLTLKTL